MNKNDLIVAFKDEHAKFMSSIDGLSPEDMQKPGVVGNWSVKDILSHINLWEAELVKFLWQSNQGQTPNSLQLTVSSVDAVNARWYDENRNRPLDRILDDFQNVYKQCLLRIEASLDKDLTDPQRYTWQKGRALWEWIAEDTFRHEAEHEAQIQAWRTEHSI
jgi:hypothetical protein